MATEKSQKAYNFIRVLIGKYGEKLAEKHLKRLGYKVVEKNAKTLNGEIDLVVRKGNEIIFVEVKTLRNSTWMRPVESVDWKKRKQLSKIGAQYLWMRRISRCQVSFMVVGVDLSKKGDDRFEVITNAFWAE
jgi:putative endonuclease